MTTELIKLTLEFRGLSDEEDDTKVDGVDPELEDPVVAPGEEDEADGELMGGSVE